MMKIIPQELLKQFDALLTECITLQINNFYLAAWIPTVHYGKEKMCSVDEPKFALFLSNKFHLQT